MELVDKTDALALVQALNERRKSAIAAAGRDGTIGRFLMRQQVQRRGLQLLTVFDRSGAIVGRIGEPGIYSQAAFSPDATRMAVIRSDPDSQTRDVWMFDIGTGRGRAITTDE